MVGTAGGPLLLGWLYDNAGGYETSYLVAAACSLLGIARARRRPAPLPSPNVSATTTVHRNVRRVVDAAARPGSTIAPVRFPDGTKTAADAAAAIGVDVGQIVKSLIFAVDGEVVLAYVSGANQLDETKLAAAAGGPQCRRVDADAVREATGFPIGGVPPFGHATTLRGVRRPRPAPVRRGLGGRRHVARRVRASRRPTSCERQRRHRRRPPARLNTANRSL